jgi:hypothetical protein
MGFMGQLLLAGAIVEAFGWLSFLAWRRICFLSAYFLYKGCLSGKVEE